MRDVTFNGPQDALRLPTGRVIRRGVRTEVTNDEAEAAEAMPHDVTVHEEEDE